MGLRNDGGGPHLGQGLLWISSVCFWHKSDAVTAVSEVDLESSVEMIQGIDSKQNTDLKVSHLSNNHFVLTAI